MQKNIRSKNNREKYYKNIKEVAIATSFSLYIFDVNNMENIQPSAFDVLSVPLQGSNLIEASAGTGKTFSIGIMVLRLMLRQYDPISTHKDPIFINQILMVTFTTAAVAELEGRVRELIYMAENYLSLRTDIFRTENAEIAEILDNAVENAGNIEVVKQSLRDNLLLLDECNIMTIHSFCQSTLNEFAIETNQMFGVELLTDTESVIDIEINKFWRKYITTLQPIILKKLDIKKTRSDIKEIVKMHLSGKAYFFYEKNKDYKKVNFDQLWSDLATQIINEKQEYLNQIEQVINDLDFEKIIEDLKRVDRKTKDNYIHAKNDIPTIITLYSGSTQTLKEKLPISLTTILDHYLVKFSQEDNYLLQLFFVEINCLAIQEVESGYIKYLSSNNFVTYEELIDKLHAALESPYSEVLKEKLNEKFKAVFVDEFQDTDKKQYDIFFHTFSSTSILFLIGDPKQSIYGWRKADIHTYFKAKSNVDHVYSMNVNYRSSQVVIDDMNHFFHPNEEFDTFYFQNEDERIDYVNIDAPKKKKEKEIFYDNKNLNGINIIECENKTRITDEVGALILMLLADNKFQINNKNIRPSDIGVIVRTNQQANDVKSALIKKNIPSVVVNEDKVLTSAQSSEIFYLLTAVLSPTISKINRLLMSDLLGYSIDQILHLDDGTVLNIFQELHRIWLEKGVYPMIIHFSTLFKIEKRWIQRAEGERILTNFFHITELLNQMEKRKHYSPEELISWLQRSMEGLEHTGDEYELRMESDENAVNIITIHKSKGLQYKVVFVPYMDFNNVISNQRKYVQFYDYDHRQYRAKEASLLTQKEEENYKIENEREYRRLLYVAITRAESQCYIFHSKREKKSSLLAFLSQVKINDIEKKEISTDQYRPSNSLIVQPSLYANNFQLLQQNWVKLSFTGLSKHGEISIKERRKKFNNDYDAFVFDQLKFGAASGNLLHNLLEEIDFSSDNRRKEIVDEILKKYLPKKSEDLSEKIYELLDHVLNVNIFVEDQCLQLKNIVKYKRLSELEFDFPIKDFDYQKMFFSLNKIYPFQTRSFDFDHLQGLMNGKVDLFFEYDGKYYILDWKSNYLGYQLDHYSEENLAVSMAENNYHLQYLIYVVAVKKMLKNRLPNFNYERQFGGVIYFFIRGVRKDQPTGIFTAKPSYKTICMVENILNKSFM